MLRLGMSHRIGRCDGKGVDYTFNEGTNWFSNRVRHVFGLNQAFTFKLYAGDKLVGMIQETNKGTPSLTVSSQDGDEYGSAVLQMRHFHGDKDLWLVKNDKDTEVPYYVPQAVAVLFGMSMADAKTEAAAKEGNDKHDAKTESAAQYSTLLLESVPEAEATYPADAVPEAEATSPTEADTTETSSALEQPLQPEPAQWQEKVPSEHV